MIEHTKQDRAQFKSDMERIAGTMETKTKWTRLHNEIRSPMGEPLFRATKAATEFEINLTTAAPDMYEALKQCEGILSFINTTESNNGANIARAALALAEGR